MIELTYCIMAVTLRFGCNKFQMRNQNMFTDKFSQYLSRKIGATQAEDIVFGQRKASQTGHTHLLTPHRHGQTQYQNSPSQSSLNSSNFCSSYSRNQPRFNNESSHKTSARKRLRKMRDIQENVCSICLDGIKYKAQMSCRHAYCNSCLQEWLKTSSRCPYCRADCPYYTCEGVQYRIEEKEFQYEGGQEVDDGLDYECYLCETTNEGDEVLICDRCEVYACHMECDPRLRGVVLGTDDEWFCHFCL